MSVSQMLKSAAGYAFRRAPLTTTATAAAAVIAAGVAVTHVGDVIVYSDGMDAGRKGQVIKFSHKGFWPCTSWEGQMAMDGFRANEGVASNVFEFSVRDPKVIEDVLKAYKSGATVMLGYRQTFSHWSCVRGSDYWADKITFTEARPK